MSEDLKPNEQVGVGLIGGTKLKLRDGRGNDAAADSEKGGARL